MLIPAIAFASMCANAQSQTYRTRSDNPKFYVEDGNVLDFQDGKVLIFNDGTAKVITFDNVEATMKVKKVAKYLKDYDGGKTTRMTLMFMYPIEGLAEAQPLAQELLKVGVRVNVANNETMLNQMNQPEYHLVRIYGPDEDGLYRFEMICNTHRERMLHQSSNGPYPYKDLSISGDAKLMLKWIDYFYGHGLAIYPSEYMPCSDLQKFANAAWGRGINQVSVVQKEKNSITVIPQGTDLVHEYGNTTAIRSIDRMNAIHTEFENSEVIGFPRFSYAANESDRIVKIVRTEDKTVLIQIVEPGPDLHWQGDRNDGIIKYNGKEYHQTGSYGLEGFEEKYLWCPDWGCLTIADYYPALPSDAKTVELCLADGTTSINNLQVSNSIPADYYKQFVTYTIGNTYAFKKLHEGVLQNGRDNYFKVETVEFSDKETTIHCVVVVELEVGHTFKGFIDDFKMTLPDGTELASTGVEGLPAGQEFERSRGDSRPSYYKFDLAFPKLEPEKFQDNKAPVILTGNICNENVTVSLVRPDIESIMRSFGFSN